MTAITKKPNHRRSHDSGQQALPKRRSDLTFRNIDGQTVILNREKGVLHQLNCTATLIWDCCDGKHGIGDIVDRLAKVCDVDSKTGRKDVARALTEFRDLNLLEMR